MEEPKFRFRLNGEIIPEILVQTEMLDGSPIGKSQIVVNDFTIGWFTIDDNENLWDEDVPTFVLEFRNETAWGLDSANRAPIQQEQGMEEGFDA